MIHKTSQYNSQMLKDCLSFLPLSLSLSLSLSLPLSLLFFFFLKEGRVFYIIEAVLKLDPASFFQAQELHKDVLTPMCSLHS
jgi:hypothetical protein